MRRPLSCPTPFRKPSSRFLPLVIVALASRSLVATSSTTVLFLGRPVSFASPDRSPEPIHPRNPRRFSTFSADANFARHLPTASAPRAVARQVTIPFLQTVPGISQFRSRLPATRQTRFSVKPVNLENFTLTCDGVREPFQFQKGTLLLS